MLICTEAKMKGEIWNYNSSVAGEGNVDADVGGRALFASERRVAD